MNLNVSEIMAKFKPDTPAQYLEWKYLNDYLNLPKWDEKTQKLIPDKTEFEPTTEQQIRYDEIRGRIKTGK